MANVLLSPIGNGSQFFGTSLVLLSGGTMTTYIAGTSTLQATYTSNLGTITNANPIVLNSDGRPPNEIWLLSGISYKLVLADALGNIIPNGTYDNIAGIPNLGTIFQWSGSATGTSDALALTPSLPITSYAAGQSFEFLAISANTTTTPTVAVSGLLPKVIVNRAGSALTAGDIQSGLVHVNYDGTNFRLLGVDTTIHSGVLSPSYELDISDNQNASAGARIANPNSGSSARAQILLNNDLGGVGSGLFKNSSTNSGSLGGINAMSLMNNTAAPLIFGTNNTEAFRIDANNFVSGFTRIIAKAVDTSRNTTTTLADDPELLLALVAGTYRVAVRMPISVTTSAGMGFKFQLNYTGAITAGSSQGCLRDPTSSQGLVAVNASLGFASAGFGASYMEWNGILLATASGNLTVQWCQNSSSGNNLTMKAGASLEVIKTL